MPHNVASVQGLHCLLEEFSFKNKIEVDPTSLKMTNALVQHITLGEYPVYNGLRYHTSVISNFRHFSLIFSLIVCISFLEPTFH